MTSDCGCGDEFAALATKTDAELDVPGPDPRGGKITKWGPDLIAPYGKPTGDKRRFRAGSLTNRELPVALKWQREDSQGHSTSVVVGTLDGVEYTDEGVMGWGILLDPDPAVLPRLAEDVAEARLLLEKKVIGPSVDIDDMEFQPYGDPGELSADTRPEVEVTKGRISAATLVQIPAFAEARPFTLTEMDADEYAEMTSVTAAGVLDLSALPVASEAEWDVLGWLASDLSGALYEGPEGVLFPVAAEVDGALSLVPAAVADAVSVLAYQADQVQLGEGTKTALRERLDELSARCGLPATPWSMGALTASAGGRAALPARAFEDPKLTGPTPVTWEELPDGTMRVYGHIATWNTCHIGFPGTCVTPPRSRTGYSYFHTGEVDTDAGPVSVGKITLGGGHADTRLGFQAALAHYDDSGAAVVDARAGEDAHGIWFSGVPRPDVDADKLRELRASPLSGDWRRIGGNLEMVAALAVNTPGFPVPRVRQAGGRNYAMVAAGVMYDPSDERIKADLTGKKKRKRREPDDDHDYEYAVEVEVWDTLEEFGILDKLKHLHGPDGKFMRKSSGGGAGAGGTGHAPGLKGLAERIVGMEDSHLERTRNLASDVRARSMGGSPEHTQADVLVKLIDAEQDRRRLARPLPRVSGADGPTRGDNMRRLAELEDRAEGDAGLSGDEAEELRRLRRLIRGGRDDDDEPRGLDVDYAAAGETFVYDGGEETYFGSLTHEARMSAAQEGKANPDGSYPIRNVGELEKAIQAYGRAKNKAATKRLIMRRARELKRPDLIPEGWRSKREFASDLAVTIEADLVTLDRLAVRELADVF